MTYKKSFINQATKKPLHEEMSSIYHEVLDTNISLGEIAKRYKEKPAYQLISYHLKKWCAENNRVKPMKAGAKSKKYK